MPLVELTRRLVWQACIQCTTRNRVDFESLKIGTRTGFRDEFLDDYVIALPACSTCGATEYLLQSPANEPEHPRPGSFGHLHRLLVDQLHARLAEASQVIPALGERVPPARPVPQELLDTHFPDGLRIPEALFAEVFQPTGGTQ